MKCTSVPSQRLDLAIFAVFATNHISHTNRSHSFVCVVHPYHVNFFPFFLSFFPSILPSYLQTMSSTSVTSTNPALAALKDIIGNIATAHFTLIFPSDELPVVVVADIAVAKLVHDLLDLLLLNWRWGWTSRRKTRTRRWVRCWARWYLGPVGGSESWRPRTYAPLLIIEINFVVVVTVILVFVFIVRVVRVVRVVRIIIRVLHHVSGDQSMSMIVEAIFIPLRTFARLPD